MPSSLRGAGRDFRLALGALALRSSFAILTGNRYPSVFLYVIAFFACRNAHDADGIADHVGGALLRPVGLTGPSNLETAVGKA